jgi:alkanesulfonate monooxygenase SsuD/methylene tetrahydromethanopterin reductase-like flavin-dependent oxidoreductase (luciferase family)
MMTNRGFRFGVVAAPSGDGDQWRGMARQVEDLGYSTLLMPDGMQLLSPWPALAIAASATSDLRVGTFVLASPLRQPRLAAWDAHSLSVLTDGRLELGVGTGRPEVAQQAVELVGMPPTTGAQRLAMAAQTIDDLRELDGDRHTPVMVAASGPKARAMAAAKADIVTLARGPLAAREEMAGLFAELREMAGDRADRIELAMNLFVVGEELPPWIRQFLNVDATTLIEHDSLAMLRGSAREMADELQRRREQFGVSYITVNSAFFQELAPVVELLNGT